MDSMPDNKKGSEKNCVFVKEKKSNPESKDSYCCIANPFHA